MKSKHILAASFVLVTAIPATAQLDPLISSGEAFPGGGVLTRTVDYLNINEAGQIAFLGDLVATENGGLDNQSVALIDGENVVELVRKGDPLPGGEGTFSFVSFSLSHQFAMDDLGGVYHFTPVSGTSTGSSAGLFRYHVDGNQTIALSNVPIPELGDFYPKVGSAAWSLYPIDRNSDGILFLAALEHASEDDKNALIAWDTSGTYEILIEDGFQVGSNFTGFLYTTPPNGLPPIAAGNDSKIALITALQNNETETADMAIVTLDDDNQPELRVRVGGPSADGLRTVELIALFGCTHAGSPIFATTEIDFANNRSLRFYHFNGNEVEQLFIDDDELIGKEIVEVNTIHSKGDGNAIGFFNLRGPGDPVRGVGEVLAFVDGQWSPLHSAGDPLPLLPGATIANIATFVPINKDDYVLVVTLEGENVPNSATIASIDGELQFVSQQGESLGDEQLLAAFPDVAAIQGGDFRRVSARIGNSAGQMAMGIATGENLNNPDNVLIGRWTPSDEPPATFWAGYPVETAENSQWVNTGDFLGWINIDDAPLVWITDLNREAYMFENYIQNDSGYVFFPSRNGQSMSWDNPSVVDGAQWVNTGDFLG